MINFQDLCAERNEFFESRINALTPIYMRVYNMPELDPLRFEISLCLLLGLDQAALTLTNHLTEWFIKLMVIYYETIQKQKDPDPTKSIVTNVSELFKEGIDSYMGKEMGIIISRAKTLGIITKDEWKQLDLIRDQYRNSFGHADSNKIFGNSEVNLTGAKLTDEGIVTEKEKSSEIASLPFLHGRLKIEFARAHALDYFIFVDGLIRRTLPKVLPSLGKNTDDINS